ncbi:MAG: B12-binding domain-containing radical SAM protein [Acidobacteria bacterium RIFCSPLOWO2_02_FULL_65_29]|nr:MAG: B12-binding domain-containing radical SAM protein [Acidobacteria bacterium RIFCSPLOWO2_02_FULL_65_29]
MMDLVLVNPGSRAQIFQSLGARLTAVENPVWAGLIATFARRRNLGVAIVDAEALELTPDRAADTIVALHPRLVAVVVYGHQPSASTQNMTGASAIVSALKRLSPSTKIVMVGGHVAALPRRTLQEEACDFAASDEGLEAVTTLAEALCATGDPDLRRVPGLVYRKDGGVVSNPAAPILKDLDRDMPGIAWDLLPMPAYRAHNWHSFGHLERQPYAAIYTTLGCPYHCAFCCIQAPFKSGEKMLGLKDEVNSYRFWSPARVLQEIDLLVGTYGVRNIKFADEMFVLNERHVMGICDRLIERGYDLNIWAYARVDTVRSGMLDKLKRAGFNWLALGIEAADERVLTDANKRYKVDEVHDTVRRIQEAGINVIGNFIFGLPEDTVDTMRATLDLALDLKCEFANFYSAMAYPGSPLYDQALKLGWRLPDAWSGYSQHSVDTLPLPTRHVSAADVLRFRDQAFHTYFTDSSYLEMVRRKFGDDTVSHLHEMTAHRLVRAHAPA